MPSRGAGCRADRRSPEDRALRDRRLRLGGHVRQAAGDRESADLLAKTLDEEERTDKKLSEIAESAINIEAAQGADEDMDEQEEEDEDEE
jgi:hypothetical protein